MKKFWKNKSENENNNISNDINNKLETSQGLEFKINKAKFDVNSVEFNDSTVEYDGTLHGIEIEGKDVNAIYDMVNKLGYTQLRV